MDHSGLIIAGDLPQRAVRSQALVRVIDEALPQPLVLAARRAISRLGTERLAQSYFTTFWVGKGERPRNAVERVVSELWKLARPRGCVGCEWWIGRAYTNDLPIEFHFDEDVLGKKRRHPRLSSVFFFNRVRGGQLAVTDALPGRAPSRLEAIAPRRNRYALFSGDLLHGVLDRDGRTPRKKLPGPRGRLRVTLVVNFWDERPTGVQPWSESRHYRALGSSL